VKRYQKYLLGIFAAVVLLAPLPKLYAQPSASMEEGSLLEYPSLALHGEIPTKAYWTEYGPLNVWTPAAAYAIAGTSVPVERTVGLLYRVGLLLALFAILRRWSRRAALASVLICWLLLSSFGLMAYSWIGGLAALLAAIAFAREIPHRPQQSRLLTAAAGLSAGIALGFRPDLILALTALAFVTLWKAPKQRCIEASLAFALGCIPLLALVLLAGFHNVLTNLVLDPVFHLRAGRHLPFPPRFSGGGEYFTTLSALNLKAWQGPGVNAQIVAMFWLLIATGLVLALSCVFIFRRAESSRRWDLSVLITALALAPQMLQRLDLNHLRFVACIWLPLAVWATVKAMPRNERSKSPWPVALLAFAVTIAAPSLVTVAYCNLLPGIGPNAPRATQQVRGAEGRSITMDKVTQAKDLQKVITLARSRIPRGSRLIEGPSDLRFANYSETSIYWLLPQLDPATYFLEVNPGITNVKHSGFAAEIARADWLILSSKFVAFKEPNSSVKPGWNGPNLVVAKKFCLSKLMGHYEVLRRLRFGESGSTSPRPLRVGPEHVAWCARP